VTGALAHQQLAFSYDETCDNALHCWATAVACSARTRGFIQLVGG
jgi:hypothetical protein